jgi:pyruvate formate lyase activating enzyme
MNIGGFQKVSLIDDPGRICAVVFTQGCNFRCPYCHNPELVDPARFGPPLNEAEILAFLERRRGTLDGVSITGGEPTLQPDLAVFAARLKDMGFRVKIDTNGSRPEVLRDLIERRRVDALAMDVKGPLKKYERLTGVKASGRAIRESIGLILASGLAHEFRTTAVPSLLTEQDFRPIGRLVEGAASFIVQTYVRTKQLDPAVPPPGAEPPDLSQCAARVAPHVARVRIR